MRNYVRNGDFRILHPRYGDFADDAQGKGCVLTADAQNNVVEIANINGSIPLSHGICPGWGHGAGGGAISRVRFIERAWHEARIPAMPQRWLWIGWDQPLDPEHGADGSGWPYYRYTFLETFFHDAHDLLGQYVAYSFYATTGGDTLPVLPVLWTNYGPNDFVLHDLQAEHAVGTDLRRYYGIVKVPHLTKPATADFYIGFGLDSTTPTPCPVLIGDLKVWRVPDLYAHVESRHVAIERAMLANWYVE